MAGTRKITLLCLAWAVAAVYLYAGGIKLVQPDALLADILSYDLLPYRLAFLGAFFLPALEVVAGIGILLRRFRRESALILLALTAVFIAALASAWMRGLDISCGCFGKSEVEADYLFLIGRDLLILAACAGVLFLDKPKQ